VTLSAPAGEQLRGWVLLNTVEVVSGYADEQIIARLKSEQIQTMLHTVVFVTSGLWTKQHLNIFKHTEMVIN
jgi:hypothetical protein